MSEFWQAASSSKEAEEKQAGFDALKKSLEKATQSLIEKEMKINQVKIRYKLFVLCCFFQLTFVFSRFPAKKLNSRKSWNWAKKRRRNTWRRIRNWLSSCDRNWTQPNRLWLTRRWFDVSLAYYICRYTFFKLNVFGVKNYNQSEYSIFSS